MFTIKKVVAIMLWDSNEKQILTISQERVLFAILKLSLIKGQKQIQTSLYALRNILSEWGAERNNSEIKNTLYCLSKTFYMSKTPEFLTYLKITESSEKNKILYNITVSIDLINAFQNVNIDAIQKVNSALGRRFLIKTNELQLQYQSNTLNLKMTKFFEFCNFSVMDNVSKKKAIFGKALEELEKAGFIEIVSKQAIRSNENNRKHDVAVEVIFSLVSDKKNELSTSKIKKSKKIQNIKHTNKENIISCRSKVGKAIIVLTTKSVTARGIEDFKLCLSPKLVSEITYIHLPTVTTENIDTAIRDSLKILELKSGDILVLTRGGGNSELSFRVFFSEKTAAYLLTLLNKGITVLGAVGHMTDSSKYPKILRDHQNFLSKLTPSIAGSTINESMRQQLT
jgi:hypothetical protein